MKTSLKTFLATWLGAFLLITALLYALGPMMAEWPVWLRALVLSGLMVLAMQSLMSPVISMLTNTTSKMEKEHV